MKDNNKQHYYDWDLCCQPHHRRSKCLIARHFFGHKRREVSALQFNYRSKSQQKKNCISNDARISQISPHQVILHFG